jgi:uncharacterized protein YegJ (DUF2314 family)
MDLFENRLVPGQARYSGMGRVVFLVPILLIPLAFFSCGKRPPRLPLDPVPALSGDPTQHRAQNDGELARIAENARNTLPLFFRRLQRPLSGDGNFRIKYPLKADPRSGFSREQIWLSEIRFKDGRYSGVLVNTPYYVSGLARGSLIPIDDIEEITDWMFTQGGTIVGGRSIKFLLEQIPEDERDEEQRRILEMFEPD